MIRRLRCVTLLMETLMMTMLATAQWHVEDTLGDTPLIHEEPLFCVCDAATSVASAPLLFVPTEVVACTGFDRTVQNAEGRDFTIDRARARLVLTTDSRIPSFTHDQIAVTSGSPNAIDHHVDGEHWVRWGESDFYQRDQILLSYHHDPAAKDRWQAPRPDARSANLPRTRALLKDGKPLRLVLFGDSISEGANATKSIERAPHMPCYGELVAVELQRRHGSQVEFLNPSKGGMTSDWAAEQAPRIAAMQPDLLIIAFGMNDGSWRIEPARYLGNIRAVVDAVRAANPQAEVMLVATMLGNPEWSGAAPDALYEAYREGLRAMTGPGIALADVTALWRRLLERKQYYDLTGNGVNHPNDFGHRVYAKALLDVIAAE